MDLCGDDLAKLASTVVANLDKVAAAGQTAIVIFPQGTSLPPSWLEACAPGNRFHLSSGQFEGDLCLPWDDGYQAKLRSALVDVIGPAIRGHAALAGVYFTISTMTNGAEMHFRVKKADVPYPGDTVFHDAYKRVMTSFQDAFGAPIVFEAGHCIWSDAPDCETPRVLYRFSRDTYGVKRSGIALWNCAERFWAGTTGSAETFGAKALIEEASADGASVGCQTVGSFTRGACRFSDPKVGNYGTNDDATGDNCPADAAFDPAGACVDTMRWFAGVESQANPTAQIRGTWAENWSAEFTTTGVYVTSDACKAAIDLLAP